jgi:hypothetical protein
MVEDTNFALCRIMRCLKNKAMGRVPLEISCPNFFDKSCNLSYDRLDFFDTTYDLVFKSSKWLFGLLELFGAKKQYQLMGY